MEMSQSREYQGKQGRITPDSFPVYLPDQAVSLVDPPGAIPASFLFSLAIDFAKYAVLVAETEEIFRV